MKRFLLGVAAGAIGAIVITKLMDEETRAELCSKARNLTDKAREGIEQGLATGRNKAMRAGVIARQEIKKGQDKINETAGDWAGKLSEELSDFEKKTKAKS